MTAILEDWGTGQTARVPHEAVAESGYVWSERELSPGGRIVQVGDQSVLLASASMEKLFARIQHAARVPVPVLLLGETGTGKEWLAHAVHVHGSRSSGPFKVLNCGSIPASLVEATLFGAERGAFTGALRTTRGVFEQARGGTVFLDELGELPLAAQAALLRVLDGQPFVRIGGSEELRPDVRVVAATNRDLEEMVAEGSFREDLYYRLSTVALRVPPLRERRAEIAPLSGLFLRRANQSWGRSIAAMTPEFVRSVENHEWPGNVRQLRNAIESAVLRCQGPALSLEDLPVDIARERTEGREASAGAAPDPCKGDYRTQVRAFETRLILEALKRTGGNQRKAAALLKLPHRTLVHKIRAYEIRRVYRA